MAKLRSQPQIAKASLEVLGSRIFPRSLERVMLFAVAATIGESLLILAGPLGPDQVCARVQEPNSLFLLGAGFAAVVQ